MTKVYENAIYVLRAMEAHDLYPGRPNASEATIQAFVGLEDAEFEVVMVYLHQSRLVSGAGNKAEGSCWLTAEGINELKNASRLRLDISFEAERLLRFIVSVEPPQGYHDVPRTSFADVKDSMSLDRNQYDRLIVELHDLGLIESGVLNTPHITRYDVRPTSKGRTAVRNGFQLSHDVATSHLLTPDPVLVTHTGMPPEITDSLARFRSDYPESERTAFIMMRFRETAQHKQISETIRITLREFGIIGLRADDKEYHRDQWPNIETYMIGCTFGIAVFDQIEDTSFNPNVALEVGYMMALRKEICLLKDRRIVQLPSDLLGKLYHLIDTYAIDSSIPPELKKWVKDKGFGTQ